MCVGLRVLREQEERGRAAGSFSVEELARLAMDFYKRNYIEGLFLSSGGGCPNSTRSGSSPWRNASGVEAFLVTST